MRIDIHTYIGHWPFRQLRNNTCAALVRQMDRYGIDQAWVGSTHGIFYRNCQAANEELAETVSSWRNRLVPFATLNPTYAEWERDLEICVRRLGMKGLRLYPQYHGYEVDSAPCAAIVRAAQNYELPVAFTQRLEDERQHSWLDPASYLELERIVQFIKQVPNGKFLVLHAFPASLKNEEAVAIVRNSNILFDTLYATGVPVGVISAYSLVEAAQKFGARCFAFGTAAPFRDHVSHLLRIETLKEWSKADTEAIWAGNAKRFLL